MLRRMHASARRFGSTGAARRLAVALVATVFAIAACTTATPSEPTGSPAGASEGTPQTLWPAPPNPLELTVAAGLEAEATEELEFHVHAHLDVFVDGRPVEVPAGIGINTADPEVKIDDEPDGSKRYAGITLCAQPCISPLHTHAHYGIIHTESATPTQSTLGQFFIEWGVTLTGSCVGEYCSPDKPIEIYVDGVKTTQDPSTIELSDMREIAIIIGTRPPFIPTTADFSKI